MQKEHPIQEEDPRPLGEQRQKGEWKKDGNGKEKLGLGEKSAQREDGIGEKGDEQARDIIFVGNQVLVIVGIRERARPANLATPQEV